MPQSFTSMDARTQLAPIRLSVDHAEEVIDALQWVVDDWQNMDATDKLTHQGYLDTYNSIKKQLETVNKDAPLYPEPKGEPSY